MYQNSLFPLRTVVGNPIPIKKNGIKKIYESSASKNLNINYEFEIKDVITETRNNLRYTNYLPGFIDNNINYTIGDGMNTLPLPPHERPFADNEQISSVFAISKLPADKDVSRNLSVRFQIELPEKFLVGGICFGGFPYSPYQIKSGQVSSNFGLPREVRLTCLNRTADEKDSGFGFEFLDAEISATKQEIVSDSGFNYLCVDPTLTNVLTVHFSDYPIFLISEDVVGRNLKLTEHYGFAIPYFYVFEYQEKTRYRPTVSGGVLGLKTTTNQTPQSLTRSLEYKYLIDDGSNGNYFDFTAASIFGQQRKYKVRDQIFDGKKPKGKIIEEFNECFISRKISSNKGLILYLEQGEEFERCIAGLKMFMPFVPDKNLKEDIFKLADSLREFSPIIPVPADDIDEPALRTALESWIKKLLKLPDKVNFCEKIGIRVFEIDPTEGVSPLSVNLDSKYATLLAECEIDDIWEIALSFYLQGIRFVRPSNSRFFAVELTNLDSKAGQFVVKYLKFVQSAHVSVHPRAAKTQQIKTINFRLIGENLAEDYALLGEEGFNFSIERFVAGERKSVLFRANSLMDLLHTGAAKIFANGRRRAVEFEKSENYPGAYENDYHKYLIPGEYESEGASGLSFKENYERRISYQSSNGWRSSEVGDNVVFQPQESKGINISPSTKFESYGNQESRSHIELLFPVDEGPWSFLRNYFGLIADLTSRGFIKHGDLLNSPNGLRHSGWANKHWRGFTREELKILGTNQVSTSPFSQLRAINDLIDFGREIENPLDFVATVSELLLGNTFLVLTGGVSSTISVQPVGLGVSLGAQPYPHLSHSTTYGSSGNINKQAYETRYSFNQSLLKGGDQNDSKTIVNGSEMKRIITRREVPAMNDKRYDTERIKGAEVMWQGEIVDIITGSIPLNFDLPATAGKMHFRNADDSLRVRFGSGVGKSISVDFWFDITEEVIRDDY